MNSTSPRRPNSTPRHSTNSTNSTPATRQLILDLTDLSFCDSSGLNVLVWAQQTFPDGALLHQPSRQLRKILQTTRLDQTITID